MKDILVNIAVLVCLWSCSGKHDLPALQVSENNQYLETVDNEPFLWIGGTAWEMIHRLNRNEIKEYLDDRASKGFTLIQTVILAELDGLNSANAYGHKPLIDNDPAKINEKYFELVDFTLEEAEKRGLYIGLLPSWGDKFHPKWGVGPKIFNPQNAMKYGEILAKRYQNQSNIIWILGGDRIPEEEEHYAVINAMAEGIRSIDSRHLITYHPVGGQLASSYFDELWLTIDMFQSGHARNAREYEFVLKSKTNMQKRPVVNGESRYENIMDRFWEGDQNAWMDDSDVRISAYWSFLAGAAGYTYGCNDIWQMYSPGREPQLYARTAWNEALHLPGSKQMLYLKRLLTSLPWYEMKFDESLVKNENPRDSAYIISARGIKNDYLLAYTPMGRSIQVNLAVLESERVAAWWYNPRDGKSTKIGEFLTSEAVPAFTPWSKGRGSDFVLLITDVHRSSTITP